MRLIKKVLILFFLLLLSISALGIVACNTSEKPEEKMEETKKVDSDIVLSDKTISTFEVYKYIYEGELIENDLSIIFTDFGIDYSENIIIEIDNNGDVVKANFRLSTDKKKAIISGANFGSSIYGDKVSLIVTSNNKKIKIPIEFVVTKYISSKEDLDNLWFYGNLDTTTKLMTYDGYFIQTQTIDLDLQPLLNRSAHKTYGNYYLDEAIYIDENYGSGRFPTAVVASGVLYGYFNVDAGFLGTYDGQGNAILNMSGYNDNYGSTAFINNRGGLFGNISRKGVVKNLELTGSDTWAYFTYNRINFLASTINGTLIDVHIKIKGNEYIESTPKRNICSAVNPIAWCLSGATLIDVVCEYDSTELTSVIMQYKYDKEISMFTYVGHEYQIVDGKCLSRGDEVEWSADAEITYENGVDNNHYQNCYFFYAKDECVSLRYTLDPTTPRNYGTFECYSLDNVPSDKVYVFTNPEYWVIDEETNVPQLTCLD